MTSTGFSFDASGNLTANGAGTSYTFNPETFMAAAGASITYSVDTLGRRTKKTVSGVTTNYFYSGSVVISEKQGSTWTDYIFFGNQRIAQQTGSSLTAAKFLHQDHLRSTRRCTDSSGNSNGSCDYEPFGEFQPGSSCSNLPTNYRFAGMEYDSETTLYHTVFRQYDPNQGRWTAVDSIPGKPDTPQSQDRYVYVLNDPVNNVDPLGLLYTDVYWIHIEFDTEGVFDPDASFSVLIGQICRNLDLDVRQRLGGGGGGGGQPSAPKPPGLPSFSQAAYSQCANQAFGSTSGNIPSTDRSIPGYDAALALFQASLLTGADPATVAGTMAFESNFNLAVATQFNPGTLSADVGPMQLNTGNIGDPSFPTFPGAYGSAVVGEPFNGNVLANVMSGASYLNRLGRHPENYAAPLYRRGRRRGLKKLDQYLRSFFDCLARNSVPSSP